MSWADDRDDGPREGGVPPHDGEAGEENVPHEPEPPPPSTYAGRMRASGGEEDAAAAGRGEGGEREEPVEQEPESAGESPPAEEEPPAAEVEQPAAEEPSAPAAEEPSPPAAEELDSVAAGPEAAEEPSPGAEAEPPDAEAEPPAAEAEPEAAGEEPEAAAEEPEGAGEGAEGAEAEAPVPAAAPVSREQSTEAALAGLRARTAGKGPQDDVPPQREPAPAAVAVEAATEDGKPPRAKPIWARFLAASLVIVISMAAATSISLLLFLTDIAAGLGGIPDVEDDLTEVDPGDAQTFLILGSDKRPTDDTGRSDTAILLRVDPHRKAIAMLSIPRDLKVLIPGHGTDKFNAAYSYGGPELTLKTVQQLTAGTGLEVNHVVNVNFTGFADAVNAIDCVYVDVDRRYFIPPESGIAEIDIEAGYQRLCGLKALQYVRYRHEDNDLVRAARQQDFIREARQNLPPSKLIEDRDELLDIFADYTTSDKALKDPIAVFELIKTFYYVRNVPVREVHFPAELGTVYVNASDEAIQNAIDQFLGTEGTPGPAPAGEAEDGDKQKPDGDGDKDKPDQKPEPESDGPPMTDISETTIQYAQKIAGTETKGGEPMVDFDIWFPAQVPPSSVVTPLEASRAFPIDGPGDDEYRGYKFVLGVPGSAGFTEYFGVSGTDWTNPPILENPSETREIDGREYQLYYDGDRLRLVGWKSKNASYWVNNTLLQTLEEGEMLAIAGSMRELND